jgi:hypothetical protein
LFTGAVDMRKGFDGRTAMVMARKRGRLQWSSIRT